MTTVTVDSEIGYAQVIETGGHRLTSDESIATGGTDTGASPYGLLLASLGACTSITLRMYADRKGWQLGQIHVELRHHKSADGADHIERDLRFEGTLTDEQRGRLAEIAEKTPVTKTIKRGTPIVTKLT